jgi:sugar/nucleoside kinase (ribokinase family)
MSVLIVGSVALDSIETPFGKAEDALGGSATYAGTAASYFAEVGVVGVVGSDFPGQHIDYFRQKGIGLEGLQTDEGGKTFRWKGYYDNDLNIAHTLDTQLGSFENFSPAIPDSYRNKEFVLLGNIDPELQLQVLDQVRKPRLALCDTMNFWITGKPEELLKVLRRVNVVCINDGEARQLCNEPNLAKAAREIMQMGVGHVIIKKGEHGCLLFSGEDVFSAPALLLDQLKDPTGAGDSFAGGFIGYLARRRRLSQANFRRAIIVGTTLASFCVEGFSVSRSGELTLGEIARRCDDLRRISDFSPVRF